MKFHICFSLFTYLCKIVKQHEQKLKKNKRRERHMAKITVKEKRQRAVKLKLYVISRIVQKESI